MLRLSKVTFGIATLATVSLAAAEEHYVAPGGADAGVGSRELPWKTMSYAGSKAVAGDVIHVATGVYKETIVTRASGKATARITYQADARWGAKIDGGAAEIIWTNEGSYVDIVGFDVTGQGRVGILNEGSFVRIVRNHVHDLPALNTGSNGGAGIDNGNYAASDCDMIGNVVHGIGTGTGSTVHGLYHSNLRGHIYNNITYNNAGWGIHTWHNPKDVIIANNLVFENRNGGMIVGAGDAPGTGVADGFIVENNILIANHSHAAIMEGGATGTNNRYANNLFFKNDKGDYTILTGHAPTGTIDADPGLVGYTADGSGDYHLAPGSACIDKALATDAPSDDLDGRLRPIGSGFDIGPYEWGELADAGYDGPAILSAGDASEERAPSETDTSIGQAQNDAGTAHGSADPKVADEAGSALGEVSSSTGGCSCSMLDAPRTMDGWWAIAGMIIAMARRKPEARVLSIGTRDTPPSLAAVYLHTHKHDQSPSLARHRRVRRVRRREPSIGL